MGLFRRAPTNDAEIEQLRAEMASLREALEQHGSTTFRLEGQLNALGSRSPEPTSQDAATAVEPVDPRVDELSTKLADLDARVTSVATELANQLTELGHDIDALSARPSADGDAALGAIRDGQVRLANEQARYQLAFREDLARLAGELKRPR